MSLANLHARLGQTRREGDALCAQPAEATTQSKANSAPGLSNAAPTSDPEGAAGWDPMFDLTAEQAVVCIRLFAAGEKCYHEAPVLFAAVRKNQYPKELGYHVAVIAVSQATAKRVRKVLDSELIKQERAQGYERPAPEPQSKVVPFSLSPAALKPLAEVRKKIEREVR